MNSTPDFAAPQVLPRGRPPRAGDSRSRVRRWLGVALAGLAKVKLLLVFGSALLSVAVYSLAFGWTLAAGFVAVLAIHELGHVWAMRRKGFPASAPYFVPLLGAVIFAKRTPHDAAEDAYIGAGGPVTGTLASWLALGLYALTDRQVFAALAVLGFLIHLFNLVPVTPLDGGRILSFLRWWAWIPAFLGLLLVFTYRGGGTFTLPVDPIDYIILFGVLATLRHEWRREKALRAAPARAGGAPVWSGAGAPEDATFGASGGGAFGAPARASAPDDRFASPASGAWPPERATSDPYAIPGPDGNSWQDGPAQDAASLPLRLTNAPSSLPLATRLACAGTWLALAAASGVGLWLALRAAPAGLRLL